MDHFLVFFLALTLQETAAVAMGMALGACFASETLRPTIGALLVTFNIVYGGAVFVADSVSWIIRWIQFVSILFYSSIMIGRNEIDINSSEFELIQKNDLDTMSEWGAMGCLMGLAVVFYVIGVVGLTKTTAHLALAKSPKRPAHPRSSQSHK